MASGRKWTEEEIVEAIDLYLQTPFGKIHSRNPQIVQLAESLKRTPSSVALKMSNLASIDETLDRKGMANASKLDREIWSKFFERLIGISTSLSSAENGNTLAGFGEEPQAFMNGEIRSGKNIRRIANAREGQQYFRKIILASYDQTCAVTGISHPALLVAGHIRPWALDSENRLNPRNGICLNRLHDKAFEENLMAIEENGRILYSRKLGPSNQEKLKRMSKTGYFKFPAKFKPDPNFLAEHRNAFIE